MAPNDFAVVDALYKTGHYNLGTHEGQARFVDDAVVSLHAKDPKWGHLKKTPPATNIHGHAEDSALYKDGPDGQLQSVDFIGNAGTPAAKPAWQPDTPRYSAKDWMDPADHDDVPAPPSSGFPYPDENTAGKAFQARVKQAYTDAHRPFPDPNDQDAFRHFMRYGFSSHEMPEPQAADKHIAELRAQLGV